jgi:hypothetical protein
VNAVELSVPIVAIRTEEADGSVAGFSEEGLKEGKGANCVACMCSSKRAGWLADGRLLSIKGNRRERD